MTVQSAQASTIGHAARVSGVSAKMIRYYEDIGLIHPVARSVGNYRTYGGSDIETLRFIARARSLGFSVEEIARLLALWREPGRNSAEVKAIARAHLGDLDERIAALRAMRGAIETLVEHCHGDDRPECPILDDLAAGRANPEARPHD